MKRAIPPPRIGILKPMLGLLFSAGSNGLLRHSLAKVPLKGGTMSKKSSLTVLMIMIIIKQVISYNNLTGCKSGCS